MACNELVETLNEQHHTADELVEVQPVSIPYLTTPNNRVLLAHYDAKQIYYMQYCNLERPFSTEHDAIVNLYNSYFGGGMNAIVFQEMREARALAYSSYAYLSEGDLDDPYIYYAFIATQNDKMRSAIEAFDEIINEMPESEAAFELAKKEILANLSTQRTIKEDVLWAWIAALDMGVTYDRNQGFYEKVQQMTLADVKAFQQEWIKERPYTYCILGDEKDLDMNFLRTLGPIKRLSQEEIFGY